MLLKAIERHTRKIASCKSWLWAVAIVVLVGMAACGGNEGGVSKAVATIPPAPLPTLPGGTPAPPIQIILLTTPISRGETASIELRVRPNSECSIQYTTPTGNTPILPELGNRRADGAGKLTWFWQIPSTTIPGQARVRVTCGSDIVNEGISIS